MDCRKHKDGIGIYVGIAGDPPDDGDMNCEGLILPAAMARRLEAAVEQA